MYLSLYINVHTVNLGSPPTPTTTYSLSCIYLCVYLGTSSTGCTPTSSPGVPCIYLCVYLGRSSTGCPSTTSPWRTLYLSIYVYTWVEAPRDAPLPRPLAYPVCVCVQSIDTGFQGSKYKVYFKFDNHFLGTKSFLSRNDI